jgi:phospholipase/carboxylesterase
MRPKSLFPKICLYGEKESPSYCVLTLPGRGQSGSYLAQWYRHYACQEGLVIGVTPRRHEWYPMPNGIDDQDQAVREQWRAVKTVKCMLDLIQSQYNIEPQRIILAGYSAGAVVSLMSAMHLNTKFAGVVAHAGAILDTRVVPPCKFDTPILLIHATNDETFEWYERYLPMKIALKRAGYTVYAREKEDGGHSLEQSDLILAGKFIRGVIGV